MTALSQEAIDYLRAGGQQVACTDGQVIVHRDQPGRAFHVVLSGAVEVILVAEDGTHLPLARLEQGESFGEMSLLTDTPTSADVIARGDVKMLEYPRQQFRQALSECTPLRNHILSHLCENLRRTNVKAWEYFQRAEALRTLMRTHGSAGPVIAESVPMQKVRGKIDELTERSNVILVTGEAGTGKLFAARTIHEAAGDPDAPLIVVDCVTLDDAQGARLLFGPIADRPFDTTESGGGTLASLGALDLANGGTMVLQHIDALDLVSQAMLRRYLQTRRDRGSSTWPVVRVLATTSEDLQVLAGQEDFDADLVEMLTAETLDMPPLVRRRRDILPLARLFLEQADSRQDSEHHFTTSAEHALLSAKFRTGNVAELRESIETAAILADSAEISSEHIFTGPRDEGTGAEYDLSTHRVMRWLLSRFGLMVLQGGTLVFFAGIAAVCLAAGDAPAATVANAMVWGAWWPLLILSFLFIGRAWCMVCPLSTAARIVRRIGRLDLKPPDWIKNHGPWLAAGLFLVIVWSEHVFNMTSRPRATGILLVALIAAAVICALVFQRELWCRYLCPLGALGAGYSVAAMIHVRSNPNVCSTQCKTHECFKGSQDVPGCPVFHHPMYARDGHFCKLCLNCLRSCPNASARPYLRPPLQRLWRTEHISDTLVPFVAVVFALVAAMLGTHAAAWTAATAPFTLLALIAVCVGVALFVTMRQPFAREQDSDPAEAAGIMFALLVLGAGPLMAFHLGNVPVLSSLEIHVPADAVGGADVGPVGVLTLLQLGAIAVCALLAALALWRIRVRLGRRNVVLSPWRWRVIMAVAGTYVVAAAALAIMRGIKP